MATDDAARDLIARLRSGDFSEDDLLVTAHALQVGGVPPSALKASMYRALRAYREAVYPKIVFAKARARLVHHDLAEYAAGDWLRKGSDGVRQANAIPMPQEIKGTPVEHLWIAAKNGALRTGKRGCYVLSEGQLVRILA